MLVLPTYLCRRRSYAGTYQITDLEVVVGSFGNNPVKGGPHSLRCHVRLSHLGQRHTLRRLRHTLAVIDSSGRHIDWVHVGFDSMCSQEHPAINRPGGGQLFSSWQQADEAAQSPSHYEPYACTHRQRHAALDAAGKREERDIRCVNTNESVTSGDGSSHTNSAPSSTCVGKCVAHPCRSACTCRQDQVKTLGLVGDAFR